MCASPTDATPGPRRRGRTKRVSWTIEKDAYEMLLADAKRMYLPSVTAALNADLAELQEWRAGRRRFVEAAAR